MNDMRELLSGALPAPQDEPQQRDVIDAAMDWGMRRRRRDWALSGAAALAVIAVGTGVAAMSGGSGNDVSPGASGKQPGAVASSSLGFESPQAGNPWTPWCDKPGSLKGTLADYCRLYNEEQSFSVDFAKGVVPHIQAALPAGFRVAPTNTYVDILTGPDGKTNYLFPSVESASTLSGPLSCHTPPDPGCDQTSAAGGNAVVNSGPSGEQSAGYVGDNLKDPRVDILAGTSTSGGINGIAPPSSPTLLLSNAQLLKVMSDPGVVGYAKSQLQHLDEIAKQLQRMVPPSATDSPSAGWSPPSGPTDSSGMTSSYSVPSGSSSSPGGASSSISSSGGSLDTTGTSGPSTPPSSSLSGSQSSP